MTPKKIFISGPLTESGKATPEEIESNAWDAIKAGAECIKKGHYPFIPHLCVFVQEYLETDNITIPWRQWMDLDDAYLQQCDWLLSLGSSEGADIEHCRAMDLGIRIFYDIDKIPPVDEEVNPLFLVLPRLPLLPVEGDIDPLDMFTLADMLKTLKDQKKVLADKEKEYNSVIEMTELLLYQKMVEEDMQNFKRKGSIFYLNSRTLASVKAGMNDDINTWFREHEMGDLVKEAINNQTLNSQLNGMMGEGGTPDDLPEDLRVLLNFYDKLQVGVRKG